MYYKKLIKIFTFLPVFSFCQSHMIIGIKENHNVKEIRNGDEIIKNNEPFTSFNYIYSFNKTKDTINVYKQMDKLNYDDIDHVRFILKKNLFNDAELIIETSDKSIKKLKISFDDKLRTLNVNKSSFFLNKPYFLFLKNNLNISELTDLLDDFLLEDIYQLYDLKYITSRSKYKNKNFRILKAKMTTVNSQNETLTTYWQISYVYNKNGVLSSVKQKSKDEIRYSKTLINNKNNLFSYQVFWQVDERFSDDKKITFDTPQNRYFEQGTYLQVGLNKEQDYETTIFKRITQKSTTAELNINELIVILRKLN